MSRCGVEALPRDYIRGQEKIKGARPIPGQPAGAAAREDCPGPS
jgi:hypothetical protein